MTAHRFTTVPTASQLADLGIAVADDGPEAHHRDLVRLARIARRIVGPSAADEVLADADAPSIVRQRALAVVSARVIRSGDRQVRPEAQPRRVRETRPGAHSFERRSAHVRSRLTAARAVTPLPPLYSGVGRRSATLSGRSGTMDP